jgi:hypothetical protein
VSSRIQACHCGHDRASHYLDRSCDPAELAACLCRGCECRVYADSDEPKPATRDVLARPAHPWFCKCFRCKAFAAQQVAAKLPEGELPVKTLNTALIVCALFAAIGLGRQ